MNPKDRERVRALAAVIPELRSRGHSLFTSTELSGEKASASIPVRFHPAGDLLYGLEIQHTREPVSRAKVMGSLTIGQFASRDNVIAFARCLLDPAPFEPDTEQHLSDFERRNAADRDRFRELCADLKPQHYPDALHLWTAEVNGLRYFLTMDRKFCNLMTKTKQVPLPCAPIGPVELMEEWSVAPVAVPALDDDQWHPYQEGHP